MTMRANPWVPVLNVNESPIETPLALRVDGEDLILVRHGDRFVAMDRWCPHRNGDLADGYLLGKAVKCPLHGFMFSVDTGRGLNCSGFSLRVHEVKIEDGLLSVRLNRSSEEQSQ